MNLKYKKLYKEYLKTIDEWYGEEDRYKELIDEIDKIEKEELKDYERCLYLKALKEYKNYLEEGIKKTEELENLILTLYENQNRRWKNGPFSKV